MVWLRFDKQEKENEDNFRWSFWLRSKLKWDKIDQSKVAQEAKLLWKVKASKVLELSK